jgi:hypothetical protein
MTIFILDSDVEKCAQALDDNRLDAQIKAIAQTLRTVILDSIDPDEDRDPITKELKWNIAIKNLGDGEWIPKTGTSHHLFAKWARECVANYKYLVKLAQACCEELNFRFSGIIRKANKHRKNTSVGAR